jgi:serralysin
MDIVGTTKIETFANREETFALPQAATIRDGNAGRFIDGTDGSDVIYGNGGNDNIEGGDGHDVIYGGSGNDFLAGDFDNDRLYGGAGDDRLMGGWDNDLLNGGAGADHLDGHENNDTIQGSTGNDTIGGYAGSDLIVGGAGNDLISTGTGKDILAFKSALNAVTNVDTIMDYKPSADTIHLENSYFKKLAKTGTLSSSAFRIGSEALDGSDRIIYDNTTGALYYDPDGTGAAAAIQFAHFLTKPALTAKEFVVI